MADVELTPTVFGERKGFVHVEGLTDEGIEFVDSYNDQTVLAVVDYGRIILRGDAAEKFVEAARKRGLETVKGVTA